MKKIRSENDELEQCGLNILVLCPYFFGTINKGTKKLETKDFWAFFSTYEIDKNEKLRS